jgi:hypothetical protein
MNATFANFGHIKKEPSSSRYPQCNPGPPACQRDYTFFAASRDKEAGGSSVGTLLRSCLRPLPQFEYGNDGWPLQKCMHPSTGSTHAVQTRYVSMLLLYTSIKFSPFSTIVLLISYCVRSSTNPYLLPHNT